MTYRRIIHSSIFYWLFLHVVTVCATLSHNSSTVKRTDIEKDHLIPVSESEYFIHKDYEGSGTAEDAVIIDETPVRKILKKVSKSQQIDRILNPYHEVTTTTTTNILSHLTSLDKQNSGRTKDKHQISSEEAKKGKQTEEESKQPIVILQQTPTAVIVILVLLIILLICTSVVIGYLVIKIKRMRKMAAQQPKANGELDDDEYSVMMDWGTD